MSPANKKKSIVMASLRLIAQGFFSPKTFYPALTIYALLTILVLRHVHSTAVAKGDTTRLVISVAGLASTTYTVKDNQGAFWLRAAVVLSPTGFVNVVVIQSNLLPRKLDLPCFVPPCPSIDLN